MSRYSFLPSFAGLALAIALAASPADAGEVVARMGNADVTTDQLRAYLDNLPSAEKDGLEKDQAKLAQVVRTYLAMQLILKEAETKKFDRQPDIKAELDRVHDAALAEIYLRQMAAIPDGYPSESEMQTTYDANKSAFMAPRQYHVAQIFIAAPSGDKAAEDRAHGKLDDVIKRIKAKPADFGAIAHDSSEIPAEAERNGDIGWLTENQIVPSIRDAVTGLGKDGVSEPVRLDDGWHLLKLLDTRPAGVRPLSEIKDALAQQMRAQRLKAAKQAYLAKLMEQNQMAINELALSKIFDKSAK